MPISTHLLERASNRCVVAPCWATIGDWLEILAVKSLATPLVDFGKGEKFRVGVTALNWYLMDLLNLRTVWLVEGWQKRDELWLLINPMRYRLLGYQPKRPYAHDVRDYLMEHRPEIMNHSIQQHAYFALAPTLRQKESDDLEAERFAAQTPWGRAAVLDSDDHLIGMVWAPSPTMGNIPPLMGSVDYSGTTES